MSLNYDDLKRITGMTPEAARFECYWWSAKRSELDWPEREAEDREACAMSEAQAKWAQQKLDEVNADLKLKREQGHDEKEVKALEKESGRLQDRCNTWQMGESIRQRRLWMEAAEDWAKERIKGRWAGNESAGFDSSSFAVDDLETVTCEGEEARKRLEHAALWLPVYYEYARQSPRWLTWARMIQTKSSHDPFWDSEIHDCGNELKSSLGGGWLSVLGALAEWLGNDLPFSEVPAKRRLEIACFAAKATLSHVEVDPDAFTLLDAGRPNCPMEAKWAGRQLLRLASFEESTKTRVEGVYDARLKETRNHPCRGVLNATVEEGFYLRSEDQEGAEMCEIKRCGNDDLRGRAVRENGAEVLVLHVNWRETSNKDLGKAFEAFCKSIRPTKWPEHIQKAGDQDQTADKALRVLLYWRMSAAIEAPIHCQEGKGDARDFLKARQTFKMDLEKQRQSLGARILRDKAQAEDRFYEITGDTEKPWWTVKPDTI
jgi:hypothetical protein